jgi:hypothetical protein
MTYTTVHATRTGWRASTELGYFHADSEQAVRRKADEARAAQNPTSPRFAGPCPRCGGGVPNSVQPGAYPGALSRLDNATYVCSSCGTSEAMWNFTHRGEALPPLNQRVFSPSA